MDLPVPDSTTKYVETDSGKPSKDLFNWMRTVSKLLSGIGGGVLSGGVPCFSAHRGGTDQTGIPDSAFTQVNFPTEAYDVGNYFASSGWTPPAGKVFLVCNTIATAVGGTGTVSMAIDICKNGLELKQTYGGHLSPALVSGNLAINDIANGTDVYTMLVYCANAGGTSTLLGTSSAYTWFQGHWISP